ncbi:alcohol dehydrogenase [Thermococcus litoralis DSM 5473]|uniref:Alcohol dehydrogenase n=1 Tax=Thermococcus litoralis (strain ATCC 51850 / DSM 5473 / JCM 8560 / NS-C) TaxID=523849 RepID=H3ZQB8_THELN|nr:iron-containing alcohol dehydrogenase [Thermococcus litoralis]EHR77839.2 alcohol dehydrogenase [Thermococcus litoralis DSM 5473]
MMKFEYYNPTRLIFGVGSLEKLGEVASKYGKKALLVIGRGSVKKAGIFDRALEVLKKAGVEVVEFSGVESNPRLSTVLRGVKVLKENKCDMVIGLGGGSVIDASKAIAAIALYEGNPRDMFIIAGRTPKPPEKALPIIAVPTLAATGSEMNGTAVITLDDGEIPIKTPMKSGAIYPTVAIVDPELTVTVPKNYTAYGIADIIAHVTESYFNGVGGTPIQDRFAEGVVITVLEYGPRAVENGRDLEARTQIHWASIVALNGWVNVGTYAQFPVHAIEHTLSALYDVPHGAGLAVLNPAWMKFAARYNPQKFAQFAQRVFGVSSEGRDPLEVALEGINRFEEFLRSIGCPTRLSELGIGEITEEMLYDWAEKTLEVRRDNQGRLPGIPPLSKEDIVEVLRLAL